jgi:hypothetical protein
MKHRIALVATVVLGCMFAGGCTAHIEAVGKPTPAADAKPPDTRDGESGQRLDELVGQTTNAVNYASIQIDALSLQIDCVYNHISCQQMCSKIAEQEKAFHEWHIQETAAPPKVDRLCKNGKYIGRYQ